MISKTQPNEAYVWVWLPGAAEPVVAGLISRDGEGLAFNYGQSFLERRQAISIYEPELPLKRGLIPPGPGLAMAGCLRDAMPDAWGRRVILNRLLGIRGKDADIGALDELTYMLESGSDRIGALDFQVSPTDYSPRLARSATLEDLLGAAEKVEQDKGRKYIAKFSSSTDIYNVVKAEFIAMRLAAKLGLNVANVTLAHVLGKDVLLVERFDRVRGAEDWERRSMVSALTLFGLDEMMARYASYADFAEIIRHRFTQPKETLRELFKRLVFNVLCGNTDDHARNHAAFWDGKALTLTPAYDICPQIRTGNEATQAMLITGDDRMSRLVTCISAAPQFLLDERSAKNVIQEHIEQLQLAWPEITQEAGLMEVDQNLLGRRMFLNPFIFEGAPADIRVTHLR